MHLPADPFAPAVETPPAKPDRRAAVAALRAQIAGLEAAGRPAERLLLGDADLDAALPGGGLDLGALHAVSPNTHLDQPAAMGFVLGLGVRALALRPGLLVLVTAPTGAGGGLDFGAPYAPGLAGWGLASDRVLLVRARSIKDALWAAEEALRSAGAAAVALAGIGASAGCARRLQLAAEAGGGVGLVLGGIAVARSRWTIAAAASAPPDWARDQGLPTILVAPGAARFCAQVRASDGRERAFDLEWRHETGGFHCVAGVANAALAARPWRAAG